MKKKTKNSAESKAKNSVHTEIQDIHLLKEIKKIMKEEDMPESDKLVAIYKLLDWHMRED